MNKDLPISEQFHDAQQELVNNAAIKFNGGKMDDVIAEMNEMLVA